MGSSARLVLRRGSTLHSNYRRARHLHSSSICRSSRKCNSSCSSRHSRSIKHICSSKPSCSKRCRSRCHRLHSSSSQCCHSRQHSHSMFSDLPAYISGMM